MRPSGADETIRLAASGSVRCTCRGRGLRVAKRVLLGSVKLAEQLPESIGHTLTDHVIIDPLKDIAEPALVLSAQSPPGLSRLGVAMHCRRLWARRPWCRGYELSGLLPRQARPSCLFLPSFALPAGGCHPRTPHCSS